MRKIIYIFLLISLYGCGKRNAYKEIIGRAETLVDINLDSAYMLLSPISLSSVAGDENKAKYALIYSDILNKRYAYIKDDSLTQYAVDYYLENGTDLERAKAFYLLGCIYLHINDTDQCVKNLTQANKYVHDDNLLKASIYNVLGYLYIKQNSYDKAISYWEIEKKLYEHTDETDAHISCLSNIAAAYYLTGKYDDALSFFRQSHSLSLELNDTTSILYRRMAIANTNYKKGVDIDIVKKYLSDGYQKYNKGEVPIEDYGFLSGLHLDLGDVDSARHYLNRWVQYYDSIPDLTENVGNKTPDRTKISILREFQKIETKAHNYKKALEYDSIADVIVDSIHLAEKNNSIQELSEMYNSKLYKESLEKSEYERKFILNTFIIFLIATIFVVLLFLYSYRLKIRKKELELDRQHEILESLSNAKYDLQLRYDAILVESKDNDSNHSSLDNLKVILGKLSDLIEKTPRYEKNPKKFIELFLNIMNSSDTSQSGTLLYEIVNRQYDGILDHLREEYRLSQYELELCSMICMGFSNSSIRILLNHTNNYTIYNYRSKLKAKLGLPIDEDNIEAFFRTRGRGH